MEFYFLKEDVPLENSERYAMRGDILVLPSTYLDRSSGLLRLEYPSWHMLNGGITCNTSQVSMVTREDALLLLGIDDAFKRFQFFVKPEALDDAYQFQPGVAVTFEYRPAFTYMQAIIMFRGTIESLDGIRFGLEIMGSCKDLKKEDISDGTVNGKEYFSCLPGRGVITSVENLTLHPQSQKAANRIRQAHLDSTAAAVVRAPASPRSSNTSSLPMPAADHPRGDNRRSASVPLPASKSDRHGSSGVMPGMRVKVTGSRGELKSGVVKVVETKTLSDGRSQDVALLEMDPPYRDSGTDGMLQFPVPLLQYEPNVIQPSQPLSEGASHVSTDLGRNGTRSDRAAASPSRPGPNPANTDHAGVVARAGGQRVTPPQPGGPRMDRTFAEMTAAQQQIMDSYNNGQSTVAAPTAAAAAKSVISDQERRLAQFKVNGSTPQHNSSSPKASSQPEVSQLDRERPRNASTTSSAVPRPAAGSTPVARPGGSWQSLGIESMVELPATDGQKLHGVIKWIGQLGEGSSALFAGIELDEFVHTGTNGSWKGKQRFTCGHGRAVFQRLDLCQPDCRFGPSETKATPGGRPSDHRVTAAAGAGDTEKERALLKLRASDVPVSGDLIAHLPQKMEELGQVGRWRALVDGLGYNGSDIRALVRPEDSDQGASLLTVLWHWTEHKPATFGQLARALCDIRCDDIAFTLLVPALENAAARIVPKGIASNSQSSRRSQNGFEESQPLEGAHPPAPEAMVGRNKGIQGHYNSCYMDSTLFAMFAHSLAFDGALHKMMHNGAAEGVQKHLLENIVNPLRANGFVSSNHIMFLRREFDRLGDVKGLTDAEKDPEEFLNLMWQTILKADPFLKLKAPQHDDSTYIYQLFVQPDGDKKVATVQELLERSFSESELTLREVPSVLVLQMPRFGRQFKPFDKIIPSLNLDITNLLTEGSRQCGLCGQAASITCHSCRQELNSSRGVAADGKRAAAGRVRNRSLLGGNGSHANYCDVCSTQVHLHRARRGHKPQRLRQCRRPLRHDLVADQLESMELFAVICIETSHYVSFVKCDAGNDDDDVADADAGDGDQQGARRRRRGDSEWCFFDSMADRVGEQDGYNIPEVKPLPTLVEWVTDPVRVAKATSKDMPPEIRRLLCDPYMCLYQNKNMLMHG